ncbi:MULTISPECIES: TniQ family protein [Lysinibacillus]|uniref:TniQ family protein n=1 Tax=Lysinibacillus TaxID=400634 RepID=UPI00214D0F7E|nr:MULTISPECIES: TniQ family protein [Lysinibacillus]UUV23640.1 TniQ family protein [Lysinibacillus sp. FN11]UYB46511.1 TniQ family protein [Lysinibacillus capsici]
MDAHENEEENDIIHSLLSTRSVLYNLEPIGIGTPYVESMTSYISRIAIVHNVNVTNLLKGVVAPVLKKDYLKNELSTGFYKTIEQFINENSIVTQDIINALELLTCREDLSYLTMLNWQGVFPRNIRSSSRKWCPLCLYDMKEQSKQVFEPLLWSLDDIKKCDIHETLLQDECSKCNRKLSFFHSHYLVGYCQYCGTWLGSKEVTHREKLNEKELFINLNYKQLIENAPLVTFFPSSRFIAVFFNEIMENCEFNSINAFANFLGFNLSTVYSWIRNVSVPNHKSLLKAANRLNNTLFDFIYKENKYNINSNKFNIPQKRNLSIDEIKIHLERSLILVEPKSLTKVAREAGFGTGTAIKYYPDLCLKVKERYVNYQAEKNMFKKKDLTQKLNDCLTREIPISLTQFSNIIGVPIKSIRRIAPDLSKKISHRYKEYVIKSKEEKIFEIKQEIMELAIGMHKEGVYPSSWKIQQSIKNKNSFLYEEVREIWKQVLEDLGYAID